MNRSSIEKFISLAINISAFGSVVFILVVSLLGMFGCFETKKDLGKYIYVVNGGSGHWYIHTNKDCEEIDYAEYVKPKEFWKTYKVDYPSYCTKCVSDEQCSKLEKMRKQ